MNAFPEIRAIKACSRGKLRGRRAEAGNIIAEIVATRPDVGFFEIHAENYMNAGGPNHRWLAAIARTSPDFCPWRRAVAGLDGKART